VALLRYVKTPTGWKRVGVERNRRGETLLTKGEVVLERGLYQLRWYVGKKAHFMSVGESLEEAIIAQDKKAAELHDAPEAAKRAGGTFVPEDPARRTLSILKDEFIRLKQKSNKDRETVLAYQNLIGQFLECGKRYPEQIEGIDLLEFCQNLRDRKLSERTVQNYFGSITAFLNFCGIDHKLLVKKEDRPRKEDPDPIPYDKEDVAKFMSHLKTERHRLFFETLLKVGLREREATFLEWEDLNFRDSCVDVKGAKTRMLTVNGEKKEFRFQTKTRKSRTIPLETGLLEKLKAWRQSNPTTQFVFGTRKDLPDGHLLETCKEIAKAAGLVSEDWYLHRFRGTFATWSLWAGVDARTVQEWLGHTKIEMTSRYLAPQRGQKAQDKINAVSWGV
jgi:integrase